jgi:hypothetical protein
MGTGVFGGMLMATIVAPLFVPLFFRLLSPKARKSSESAAAQGVEGP